MYLKLNNGVIEKYPYTIGELRKDNPQVSFPRDIPESTLADYGVFRVTPSEAPQVTYTHNVTEGAPENTEGIWNQVWVVTEASPEEVQSRLDDQWVSVRYDRNQKLADCDWTQLNDSPLSNTERNLWADYRQALRDLTDQPDPFNLTWPTAPGEQGGV